MKPALALLLLAAALGYAALTEAPSSLVGGVLWAGFAGALVTFRRAAGALMAAAFATAVVFAHGFTVTMEWTPRLLVVDPVRLLLAAGVLARLVSERPLSLDPRSRAALGALLGAAALLLCLALVLGPLTGGPRDTLSGATLLDAAALVFVASWLPAAAGASQRVPWLAAACATAASVVAFA